MAKKALPNFSAMDPAVIRAAKKIARALAWEVLKSPAYSGNPVKVKPDFAEMSVVQSSHFLQGANDTSTVLIRYEGGLTVSLEMLGEPMPDSEYRTWSAQSAIVGFYRHPSDNAKVTVHFDYNQIQIILGHIWGWWVVWSNPADTPGFLQEWEIQVYQAQRRQDPVDAWYAGLAEIYGASCPFEAQWFLTPEEAEAKKAWLLNPNA